MIEIVTLSGESFELLPETSITFKRKNPFFIEEAELVSMYSDQFSIPSTPHNDRLVNHFGNPSAYIREVKTIDVDVLVGGNLFMLAQLNIFKSPSDRYNVTLTRRYVDFESQLRLREIDFEPIAVSGGPEGQSDNFYKTFPEVPCVFPMFQNLRESGLSIDPQFQDEALSALRPINWNGGSTGMATAQDLSIPMFFLLWVIQKVVRKSGEVIATGDFFENQYLQDKLVFNTTLINTIGSSIDPPAVEVEQFAKLFMPTLPNPRRQEVSIYVAHKDYNPTDRSVASTERARKLDLRSKFWFSFEPGTVISFEMYELDATTNAILGIYSFSYTTTVFDITPSALLNNIGSNIAFTIPNASFIGGSLNNEDFFQYIRIGNTAGNIWNIIGTRRVEPDYVSTNACKVDFFLVYLYNEIKPQNHLPDLTVGEFLKNIGKFFNTAIYLDPKRPELRFVVKNNTLSGERLDVSRYRLRTEEKEYKPVFNMWLEFTPDNSDKQVEFLRKHANNYPEHVMNPRTDVVIPCSTFGPNQQVVNALVSFPIVTWAFASCPVTEMPLGVYSDIKPFALRLAKFEGVANDSNGNQYLKMTNFDLTPNEIYTYFFKNWYQVMKSANRFFWFDFDFPLEFLLNLDYTKTWQIDGNSYIWAEIETQISMRKIELTKTKLLKL